MTATSIAAAVAAMDDALAQLERSRDTITVLVAELKDTRRQLAQRTGQLSEAYAAMAALAAAAGRHQ